MVGNDPTLKPYTQLLTAWMDSGAHRVDRARTGHYTDQAAIALMDTWYPLVAKEVLEPRLGSLVNSIPTSLDNTPDNHNGSSFDNVGSYGWVTKDLESVLGKSVPGAMSQRYCGKGNLATCRSQIRQTLAFAVATVGAAAEDQRPGEVDVRQGQRRHPVHVRRGHRRAHRLAEPADLPAGGRLAADIV